MTTVHDLFAQGSHSFTDEDYEGALDFYSKALAIDNNHAEALLKRSATYQKLGQHNEAYDDAITALSIVQNESAKDSSVEAKALLRKGVAAFHLQEYSTAKVALDACRALNPELPTLATWTKKNDQELAKRAESDPSPAPAAAPSTPASATIADVTPATSPVPAHTSPATTPVPAPLTPAAHRVRHEWYQNDSFVTISVFIKNARDDMVDINITESALSVSVKMPTGSDYSLELEPLSHKVIANESRFEVLKTKIEIQLKKELVGIKWGALEGDDAHATSMASAGAAPAYPTSAKKPKNWDALEKEAAKEEEKADGDKALNQLFAQIYKDADDDTRRAMMKSFTESNGTCLSTNWDEVGKGTVETRPPEGMVAKKYNS
ncbi:Protein SGT1 A [Dissophora globulifera]|uniref:Protein SGT1 A n=1 Tax=Dissophora globulifera TaxID=979702 RepID=A0A9P6V058_9FUNG|nr:Protein SGT1 A [Dissophora globulifera]